MVNFSTEALLYDFVPGNEVPEFAREFQAACKQILGRQASQAIHRDWLDRGFVV